MKKTKTKENLANHNGDLNNNDDNYILLAGIQKLTEESTAFQFLISDEDIYTLDDIKEIY